MKKDLLSLEEMSGDEILHLLDLADHLKKERKNRLVFPDSALKRQTIVLFFEKPSLRTRITFEVAMNDFGGNAIYLSPETIQLGKRETVKDAAKNFERWVDAIVARTFSHRTLVELARYAKIPVINALSDMYHPCQALAFGQTLREHKDKLKGMHVTFVGDGNNVCQSLMILSAKLGMYFTVAYPKDYGPKPEVTKLCRQLCKKSGGSITLLNNPAAAVQKADAIYTDVWTSMGQEAETQKRKKIFMPYQLNRRLLNKAQKGCLVSHCLPAHRGEEITDEILDNSVAFDEAENRLHVQKAILLTLLCNTLQ